jgi:hypothetical protein
VHVLSGTGVAQEHFEQMSNIDDAYRIVAPTSATSYTGVAREQYEVIQAGQFSALTPSAAYVPGYAFEHYEQMEAASASN